MWHARRLLGGDPFFSGDPGTRNLRNAEPLRWEPWRRADAPETDSRSEWLVVVFPPSMCPRTYPRPDTTAARS